MKTIAIIAAAGSGKRLRAGNMKPFVLLGGIPLLAHTLKALDNSKDIDAIIVASHPACAARVMGVAKRFGIRKHIQVVVGGKTRFESVRNCIARIGASFDIVLIHDAARPFVDKRVIAKSIRTAARYGACVACVPESDTVKLVDPKATCIRKTLPRSVIYRAQTPQAFRYDIIKKAYMRNPGRRPTDDAALVEAMGQVVRIVKGSYRNLKITTAEDLKIAKALL